MLKCLAYFHLTAYVGWWDRYGVVAVRGAEVYELADEEGNLLNDPAAEKERVRAMNDSLRRLIVEGGGLFSTTLNLLYCDSRLNVPTSHEPTLLDYNVIPFINRKSPV